MLQELLTKYKSRNPCAIANFLNITILYEELGSIKGYFNKAYGCKFIHINQNLPEKEKRIVAAHELGHAVLHSDCCTPFMRANTYYSINKWEVEANAFCVRLLISDEDIMENLNYTTEQMAVIFGVPVVLMELRLKFFSLPTDFKQKNTEA